MVSFQRASLNQSFIDLYRVEGIYGVYIATQLTNARPGHRQLKTLITFDKGGEWMNISAPKVDSYGRPTHCELSVSLFVKAFLENGFEKSKHLVN